jgi:hypothetical protein
LVRRALRRRATICAVIERQLREMQRQREPEAPPDPMHQLLESMRERR